MNQYNIKQSSGVLRKILAVTLVGWFLGMSPVCYGDGYGDGSESGWCGYGDGIWCESSKQCVSSNEEC